MGKSESASDNSDVTSYGISGTTQLQLYNVIYTTGGLSAIQDNRHIRLNCAWYDDSMQLRVVYSTQ